MNSVRKINIFISYSHQNEKDKVRFVDFLRPVDIVNLDIWLDDVIEPGTKFEAEITSAIERADIAVLLISQEFLNSEFIKNKELPKILKKQAEQTLKLFPIIIRTCGWKNIEWLKKINLRPKNGKPVFESSNPNKALENIVHEIVHVANSIFEKENSVEIAQINSSESLLVTGKPENDSLQNIPKIIILPFANRTHILNKLEPEKSQAVFKNFVAIDGPAGRGKTELVKELCRKYRSANWDCAFGTIGLSEDKTGWDRKKFAIQMAHSLEIKNWLPDSNDYQYLGWQLFVEYENSKKNNNTTMSTGLAFFIDWEGEVEQDELKEFVDGFVVGIREKAQENTYFIANPTKLLIIIAGRYLFSYEAIARTKFAFHKFSLLPFVYEDVQDVLYRYLNESPDSSKVKSLSSFVLFLSGGHPGLMAKIVHHYEQEVHYPIPRFIAKYVKDKWMAELDDAVKEITKGVFEVNPALLDVAKEFCVFRYFNVSIAGSILRRTDFLEGQSPELTLATMTSLGLFQHEGHLYRDGLVSTLLALSLGIKDNQKFIVRCENAKKLCLQEMRDDYYHEKWFLEFLYISLLQQSSCVDWQHDDARESARKGFGVDLEILLLELKRMSDERKGRDEALYNLIETELKEYIIGNDAIKTNFRFLVNHILGPVTYTDTYFEKEFVEKILIDINRILGLGGSL